MGHCAMQRRKTHVIYAAVFILTPNSSENCMNAGMAMAGVTSSSNQ